MKLQKSTHQKIAESLRGLADLFDDLSVEVAARKRYKGHDYISAAKRLGVGEPHHGEVALTRFELMSVRRELEERKREKKRPEAEAMASVSRLEFVMRSESMGGAR